MAIPRVSCSLRQLHGTNRLHKLLKRQFGITPRFSFGFVNPTSIFWASQSCTPPYKKTRLCRVLLLATKRSACGASRQNIALSIVFKNEKSLNFVTHIQIFGTYLAVSSQTNCAGFSRTEPSREDPALFSFKCSKTKAFFLPNFATGFEIGLFSSRLNGH